MVSLSRRPRQSEAATFFNSLDENSDGVLAKEEIREVLEYICAHKHARTHTHPRIHRESYARC